MLVKNPLQTVTERNQPLSVKRTKFWPLGVRAITTSEPVPWEIWEIYQFFLVNRYSVYFIDSDISLKYLSNGGWAEKKFHCMNWK